MDGSGHGLDHLHKRKRLYHKLESYPHPDKWKNLIDRLVYFAAIATPFMTLPQLLKIWVEKSAVSISIVTWVAYLINAIIWLIYGIMHKEKPIIVTNVLWILMDISIIIGTLVYG